MVRAIHCALVLLASSVASAYERPRSVLRPIATPNGNFSDPEHIVPSRHVSLHYGSNDTTEGISAVNVTLSMKYPSVLLEEIASVIDVVCSSSSLVITFNKDAAYQKAVTGWPATGNFLLVTNHFGDCDLDDERGLFLVQELAWDAAGLTVTASSQKQDLPAVAEIGEFTFGTQSAAALSKRLTLDPSYTVSPALALPAATTIYSYSPYLTVTADAASISSDITFSGYLRYNFLLFKLEDLYFDIDTSLDANVELSAAVTAAYSTTVAYTPTALSYSLVSVPGILTLGPEVTFAIGANITASAAVNVSTTFGLSIADGNVHLDAVNSANSGTSGWTPTYTAAANISANVPAALDPYISLTVELAINLFSGLVDLSTGLTAKPGFNNDFIFSGSEGVSLSGLSSETVKGADGCEQGLELKSAFVFALDAFVTQFYKVQLWTYEKELLDQCFTWLS